MQLNHILCPVDFSSHNKSAIKFSIELATANQSEICFLHVHPPALFEASGEFDVEKKSIDVLDEIVEFTEPLSGNSGLRIRNMVEFGLPVERITGFVLENRIDLIVMSSHGRTGFGRLVLGSTAEGVVRHATCPVLVTKATEESAGESSESGMEVHQR
ncbi:MAG: universal stress protein [Planctomycetota bacterium]